MRTPGFHMPRRVSVRATRGAAEHPSCALSWVNTDGVVSARGRKGGLYAISRLADDAYRLKANDVYLGTFPTLETAEKYAESHEAKVPAVRRAVEPRKGRPWPDWEILDGIAKHLMMPPLSTARSYELAEMGYIDTSGTWELTAEGRWAVAHKVVRVDNGPRQVRAEEKPKREAAIRPCDMQGRRDEALFAACKAKVKALGGLTDDKKLYAFLREDLESREREAFVVVGVDHNGQLVCFEEVARGQHHKVNVEVEDILQVVLRHKCDAFAVAHPHPSGESNPSDKDDELTTDIHEAAKKAAPNVVFLDHIIIYRGGCYSYRDKGKLK